MTKRNRTDKKKNKPEIKSSERKLKIEKKTRVFLFLLAIGKYRPKTTELYHSAMSKK